MRWGLNSAVILLAFACGCAQNTADIAPASTSVTADEKPVPEESSPPSVPSAIEDEPKDEALPAAAAQLTPAATDKPMPALKPSSALSTEALKSSQPAPKAPNRLEATPSGDGQTNVPLSVAAPTEEVSQAPEGYVALAQFTTEIDDREPVDAISFLNNQTREIIFFTDLRNFGGQTLTHRWEYRGEILAEVPVRVEQDRWRAWSSKQLLPVWTGDWTVSVVKADGEVIAAETFNYSESP